MDAIKAIKTRRSIRAYEDKKIPEKLVKQLVDCARRAPSAYNDQPWVFVTTTKQSVKDAIAEHKSQQSQFIKKTPLLVCCAYDEEKSRTHHDLENVACAVENMLVAAHALGLGACYVGGYDPEYPGIEESIREAFQLPEHVHPVCLVTVGYPAEKPKKKNLKPLSEVWMKDSYKA